MSGNRIHKGLVILLVLQTLASMACGDVQGDPEGTGQGADWATPDQGDTVENPDEVLTSGVPRDLTPAVSPTDLAALVHSNTELGLDMYRVLAEEDDDLFFSPISLSIAMAMVYAGAEGTTEDEIATVLRYDLPEPALHAAFDHLDLELSHRGEGAAGLDDSPFRLNLANQLWGQRGLTFEEPFLDTLAQYYGAGLRLVDFVGDTEGARQMINEWAYEKTEGLIADLIPEGVLTPDYRLVLANAIYFNAAWQVEFDEINTEDRTFTLADGTEILVPTMYERFGNMRYMEHDDLQVGLLNYDGGEVSMAILVPAEGELAALEERLDAEELEYLLSYTYASIVHLYLPRFELATNMDLAQVLQQLGLVSAFGGSANFEGITTQEELGLAAIQQKAVIEVSEAGTEAAAVTWVGADASAGPDGETYTPTEYVLRADQPFLFVIRDNPTGTILFMGRVMDPR